MIFLREGYNFCNRECSIQIYIFGAFPSFLVNLCPFLRSVEILRFLINLKLHHFQ